MLKNFRTYQMAKELHNDCQNLNIRGEIKSQMDRASLSIVLNLAEGSGKPTVKDRQKFYAIALGSTREVQGILDITSNIKEYEKADQLGAMIYCLIKNARGY